MFNDTFILDGDLYSWGSNEHGQLGLGPPTVTHEARPQLVKSLSGIPFAFIACGGYHTFAVTKYAKEIFCFISSTLK